MCILEWLKFKSQQGAEIWFMIDVINLKEMPDGIMELGGRVKVLSGQDMTSCMEVVSVSFLRRAYASLLYLTVSSVV